VDGKWISDRDGSRLDPARACRLGKAWREVDRRQPDKQTLVLYEGEQAVFATLISSGEAGLEDPQHTSATKRGIFGSHQAHHCDDGFGGARRGVRAARRAVRHVLRQGGLRAARRVLARPVRYAKSTGASTSPRRTHGASSSGPSCRAHRLARVLLPLRGTVLFIHPSRRGWPRNLSTTSRTASPRPASWRRASPGACASGPLVNPTRFADEVVLHVVARRAQQQRLPARLASMSRISRSL